MTHLYFSEAIIYFTMAKAMHIWFAAVVRRHLRLPYNRLQVAIQAKYTGCIVSYKSGMHFVDLICRYWEINGSHYSRAMYSFRLILWCKVVWTKNVFDSGYLSHILIHWVRLARIFIGYHWTQDAGPDGRRVMTQHGGTDIWSWPHDVTSSQRL